MIPYTYTSCCERLTDIARAPVGLLHSSVVYMAMCALLCLVRMGLLRLDTSIDTYGKVLFKLILVTCLAAMRRR